MGRHRCQRRLHQGRAGRVIEGDHRQILWCIQPSQSHGPDGPDGRLLISRQQSRRASPSIGQPLSHRSSRRFCLHGAVQQPVPALQPPGLQLLRKKLAAHLGGPASQVIQLPFRADKTHRPVSQLRQVLQRHGDPQGEVQHHRVKPALQGGGVQKDDLGAERLHRLDLPRPELSNGDHAVQRLPLRGQEALSPALQGDRGVLPVQTSLADKAAEVEVEGVLQLLGRREHLCDSHPEHPLGRPAPAAPGSGIVQPPRLLQHLSSGLHAHRQRRIA